MVELLFKAHFKLRGERSTTHCNKLKRWSKRREVYSDSLDRHFSKLLYHTVDVKLSSSIRFMCLENDDDREWLTVWSCSTTS